MIFTWCFIFPPLKNCSLRDIGSLPLCNTITSVLKEKEENNSGRLIYEHFSVRNRGSNFKLLNEFSARRSLIHFTKMVQNRQPCVKWTTLLENTEETYIFFRINPLCRLPQLMPQCHLYRDEFSDICQSISTKVLSQVSLKMPLCVSLLH